LPGEWELKRSVDLLARQMVGVVGDGDHDIEQQLDLFPQVFVLERTRPERDEGAVGRGPGEVTTSTDWCAIDAHRYLQLARRLSGAGVWGYCLSG
jgi:hypothetical protein